MENFTKAIVQMVLVLIYQCFQQATLKQKEHILLTMLSSKKHLLANHFKEMENFITVTIRKLQILIMMVIMIFLTFILVQATALVVK